MIAKLFDNALSLFLGISFLCSVIYIAYLRYRMTASKARFAFFVVFSIITCLATLLNFLSGSFFFEIASLALSVINDLAGREIVRDLPPGPPSIYGLLGSGLAFVAMMAIWRFGDRAMVNWDAKPTITVSELAKQNRDNNLFSLALAEAARIAKGQPDLIASDAAINWKQRIAEAPAPPKWNDLARSLLCGAFSEIIIESGGWRGRISAWLGFMYLAANNDKQNVIVLVFSGEFNRAEIVSRLDAVGYEKYELGAVRIFAIFDTKNDLHKNVFVKGRKIEVWGRSSLLRKGLNFDSYARELIHRFDHETLGGTQSTLSDTYVGTHVLRDRHSHQRYDLAAVYEAWIRENSRRHLAIVGEYGQGKSTAMLALCVEWARAYLKRKASSGPVPLLMELRSQSPAETDPASFLAPWAIRFGLDARRIYNLIQAGEAVLIFEGFDELRNAGRAFDRHEHFNALWRLAYPGTKLVFTGRPNFFIDEAEKNRTLRVDGSKGAAGNAYTDLWEIDRLTPGEVMKALSGFDIELATSVIAAANQYRNFRDIVSRPSMLPVVATIWPEIEHLQKQGQQLTDAVLIQRYLDAAYQRKETEIENYQRTTGAPIGATYLMLRRELRETFTRLLVWDMVARDTRNTITRARLDKVVFDSYKKVFNIFQTSGSSVDTVEAIRRLEAKYADHSPQELSEMIANEVASAGLFVSDPAGGVSNLMLPHKQYYEYIIAESAFAATKKSSTTRLLLIENEKNDTVIARFILKEPNSAAYFSAVCGEDFTWFKDVPVRVVLLLEIATINLLLSMRRISEFLGRNVRRPSSEDKDTIEAVLDDVASFFRRVSTGKFFVIGSVFSMAIGVLIGFVTLPTSEPDKLIRAGLLALGLSSGAALSSWFLAPAIPKARLLELVAGHRAFQRGERRSRSETISRRLRTLHEALGRIR
ncbi:NACHT domain-containing protein [Mesorhizobium sp. C280B]|uniref:NACHT domain-containing protein n=2 Tax=Mesorhizobium TaxID=68287 RepID=UPI0003CF114D|nr:NACHT domain-containing protein [Mesorhizobium sp. LSJC280B00]ESW79895.1 hypothetical protein X772_26500 [Mesorhizobium sp. LSJC280B00]